MKFDITKRTDIGTARTLRLIESALMRLLTEDSFENITIQAICTQSMVPRSTFYNYFEDKYDLLSTAFRSMFSDIFRNDMGYSFEGIVIGMHAGFYFIQKNRREIDLILTKNGPSSYFYHALQTFFSSEMRNSFICCPHTDSLTFPPELIARFCASALWSILDLKINDDSSLTTEEAEKFLLASINYSGLGMTYQAQAEQAADA